MKLIAKTMHGLEPVLVRELEELGAKYVKPLNRAVAFEGDQHLLYKANLHLRTALRILMPIEEFHAGNERELYRRILNINWSEYFRADQTFAINATVYSDFFNHSKYVALKIKDAIVDQFRKKTGTRPNVDVTHPDIRFNVHVYQTKFSVSLDSSGESLHKRGYRNNKHKAPVNEVLAAGMVLLSGWSKETPLIDPMCGSGTVVLEAAMLARKIPPAFYRKTLGFMHWRDYNPKLWDHLREEAKDKIERPRTSIVGADISSRATDIARETAIRFDLNQEIKFISLAFERHYPKAPNGIIIMNPPYGERLEKENISAFYKSIGDHLKKHFSGYDAWILSSNMQALKSIGLKSSARYTLYNGALECRYLKFNLYTGSLRNTESDKPRSKNR
jgi:putative N6-adenine-specific DNA methylase